MRSEQRHLLAAEGTAALLPRPGSPGITGIPSEGAAAAGKDTQGEAGQASGSGHQLHQYPSKTLACNVFLTPGEKLESVQQVPRANLMWMVGLNSRGQIKDRTGGQSFCIRETGRQKLDNAAVCPRLVLDQRQVV